MAQAEQLGASTSETAIHHAAHFLVERQRSDGSWEEDQQIFDLAPAWAKPGDLAAKLYLTANCGFWLALLDNPDKRASRASEYLQTYLGQDGHLPGFLHTHWLAGGLWYKLSWLDPAELVFKYLDHRLGDLAVSNLAWLILTARAAGGPASDPLVNKTAILLAQSQQEDGNWPSEDSPGQDVHSFNVAH